MAALALLGLFENVVLFLFWLAVRPLVGFVVGVSQFDLLSVFCWGSYSVVDPGLSVLLGCLFVKVHFVRSQITT
jgi:hypothetical protein